MKCYKAGSDNAYAYGFVISCFAHNAEEAKSLMWGDGTLKDECDGDYFNVRIKREPEWDYLLDTTKKDAYIISDDKTLREMGFEIDGDERCACCNKATLDGDFPLCEECGNCEECGHAEDCSKK